MCSGGKALISLFRNPASGETGTVGLTEKKLQAIKINLLANIGSLIAKAHQLNYSFLIFIMYLCLSCKSLPFYVI